jgi:NAD(P)H-hydrate epimerase
VNKLRDAVQVYRLPALPLRPADSHKGTYGKVLLAAGSQGMAGAAILTARAALRGGAGLVTAALPRSLSAAVTAGAPEATQLSLPEPESPAYEEQLRAALGSDLDDRFDALAVGPGMGTAPQSRLLLESVLAQIRRPQVLDADALNLVAAGVRPGRLESRVWTPHPGEFRRLAGASPQSAAERVSACRRFVEQRGGVVVLKGHRTVVHSGERYFINITGNAGMATGGAGDVLTGIIVALLAQGLEAFDAARLGVFLHGLAGDLAARSLGQAAVVASDLIDFLPAAQKHVARALSPPSRLSGDTRGP